ncbi:hypothetical protein EJ110_NYTH53578 [Nymphaea thermarum]|nr:hypothetical protein EJ110_NYTH53578 [Nymphaea thermarum]
MASDGRRQSSRCRAVGPKPELAVAKRGKQQENDNYGGDDRLRAVAESGRRRASSNGKENYLQWSAAITMGIAGRSRIAYVNGRKIEPVETSVAWDTWFLEDNQVKTWLVNSISFDIQPLILHKRTARDIIMSQILNSEELFSIEDDYSRVEAEEQRQLIIIGRKRDHTSYNERSALVSCALMGAVRPPRKCTHCKKTGHTMEFCSVLHPEMKNGRGRSSSGKKSVSDANNPNGGKTPISDEQIRELRAYLSQIDINQIKASDDVNVNRALAISGGMRLTLSATPRQPVRETATSKMLHGATTSYVLLLANIVAEERPTPNIIGTRLLALLEEFSDVFDVPLPHGLPPSHSYEHHIDL